MKKCPFCAEEIQDAAIVCKHCGRELVAKQPLTWVGKKPGTAVGCPRCGTTVRIGDSTCGKCGAALPNADAPVETPVLKQRGWSTVIGVGALAFVVLAVAGALNQQHENQTESDTSGGKSDYSKMTRAQKAAVDASEESLDKTFADVVRSAGEACPSITETFYQGMHESSREAFWNVACSNGRKFVITIKPDAGGNTRVLDCAVLKAISEVECFKRFNP